MKPVKMTIAHRDVAISAAVVSALNLIGKALGMVKTLVIAWVFGATGVVDAFLVAYLLPTVLPMVFKGMITAAFVPQFMRNLSDNRQSAQWRGANTLFTLSTLLALAFAVVLVLFPGALVTAVAPGLPAETDQLATELTRYMAAGAFFLGINAVLTAIAYARQRFVFASLESVVINSFVIVGCLVFVPSYGVLALAVSVMAGFIAQTVILCITTWDLIRHALRPAFDWRHDDFRGPLRHMFPLVVGSVGALALGIVDQIFTSYLDAGSIAVLGYATMLALAPMEVFGHAIRTTFYPMLSKTHADGDRDAFRLTHINGLRLYILVMLPCMAVLIWFAEPVVALLFERGSFTSDTTQRTALVMIALVIGLLSRAVAWFNFGVFHALVKPWIPVTLGLMEVLLNIILTWALVRPLGVFGVALATSISLTVTAIVTTIMVARQLESRILPALTEPCIKIGLMTLVGIVIAQSTGNLFLAVLTPQGVFWSSAALLAGLVPGALAFVMTGILLQLREIRSVLNLLEEKWNLRLGRLFGG
jgi:putative peptidoglycan lipid II flippase